MYKTPMYTKLYRLNNHALCWCDRRLFSKSALLQLSFSLGSVNTSIIFLPLPIGWLCHPAMKRLPFSSTLSDSSFLILSFVWACTQRHSFQRTFWGLRDTLGSRWWSLSLRSSWTDSCRSILWEHRVCMWMLSWNTTKRYMCWLLLTVLSFSLSHSTHLIPFSNFLLFFFIWVCSLPWSCLWWLLGHQKAIPEPAILLKPANAT